MSTSDTNEQRQRRRRNSSDRHDKDIRLAVLEHATRLVLESAERCKRAGRPVPIKAMADDVIEQAQQLWRFVRTGE